jgi:hypothetical protein
MGCPQRAGTGRDGAGGGVVSQNTHPGQPFVVVEIIEKVIEIVVSHSLPSIVTCALGSC